ncbi:MAG: Uma2 family endonuclease [Acidobacteriaceae bacterium]
MGTSTQISLAEYMHTVYRPDREYVDGEVRERNVGKWEHARIQSLLANWFAVHESEWNMMVATEQRIRVTATTVRIPDLVVVRSGPQPDVLVDAPLLVIEILSPDDTYSSLEDRVHDYHAMGVETVWLVDPGTRSGRVSRDNNWVSATRLEIAGSPIYVDLGKIFQSLYKSC